MKVEKHDTESAYRDYYMTMSSCLPVGTRRSATHWVTQRVDEREHYSILCTGRQYEYENDYERSLARFGPYCTYKK